jgi:Regulator of chromosome condensation (RCC1) repeat
MRSIQHVVHCNTGFVRTPWQQQQQQQRVTKQAHVHRVIAYHLPSTFSFILRRQQQQKSWYGTTVIGTTTAVRQQQQQLRIINSGRKKLRCCYPYRCYTLQQRHHHTVVYAIGEGWTGALGTGRIDQKIVGHGDNDDVLVQSSSSSSSLPSWWSLSSSFATDTSNIPVILYDTSSASSSSSTESSVNSSPTSSKRLISCAVGWGHTALIVEETTPTTAETGSTIPTHTTNTQLFMTGRPHEFSSLLRLQRLPSTIRNWMAYHTYNTVRRANLLDRETTSNTNTTIISLNPIDMIGRTLTFLSKLFGNPETDPDWNVARDQSYMIVPTNIPLPFDTTKTVTATPSPSSSASTTTTSINDALLPSSTTDSNETNYDVPVHVACSAGLSALTTQQGYVYTLGLNGAGQCGIGDPCNNVWTPARVSGLSRQFSVGGGYRATSLVQSHMIQQTCLGLQRTIQYIFYRCR